MTSPLNTITLVAVPGDANSGDVPNSDGSGNITWQHGTDTSIGSGQVTIGLLQTPTSNIRWSKVAPLGGDYFGGEISSSGTQFDEITVAKYAQKGTYTLELFHRQNTTRGIYSVYVNGSLVGTIDGYAAASTLRKDPLTVHFTASGLQTVRLVMEAKNASSTSYVGDISGLTLTRTGA